jgi:flavodoxin
MNKIWIIHNSEYGNSEKISHQLAEGLKDEYEVTVKSIRGLTPEEVAKEEPYGLIVALRVLAFRADYEMRDLLDRFDKQIQKPISKIAYFFTHRLKWKKLFAKGMNKTLRKIGCVEEICPEFLEVKMEKAEGPAVEGSDEKIKEYISILKTFLK